MNKIEYNFDRLRDYALWYYFRYFPSDNKLLFKLNGKNQELSQEVFNDIKHLLQEDQILESKIRNFLDRNKNINYIRNNLLEKQFNINDINNKIDKFTTKGESVLSEQYIKRKINEYILRGKSKSYIQNKLIERKEDSEKVNNILEEFFTENTEIMLISREYEKIKGLYSNQKITEKLLRKGFNYKFIKNFFN